MEWWLVKECKSERERERQTVIEREGWEGKGRCVCTVLRRTNPTSFEVNLYD